MGHLVGKDIFRKLAAKHDNGTLKTPFNKNYYRILVEMFSEEEADIVVKMPYMPSNVKRIAQITGYPENKLKSKLRAMCLKGLVLDLWNGTEYCYLNSPFVIGFFEFTMMRTQGDLKYKEWADLFLQYFDEGSFYAVNSSNGEQITLLRTLPHKETIDAYVEIFDYEKADAIIRDADKIAVGLCGCRHTAMHAGMKTCDTPLNTCTTFSYSADYMIRNNLAEAVSTSEMLEKLAQSKELGLVLNSDNIKNNVTFLCHCCGCCCKLLHAITKYGYPQTLKTSRFIAVVDQDKCIGCGQCLKACHIDQIELHSTKNSASKKKKKAVVNKQMCIGCGVCALKCSQGAMVLQEREQKFILPETSYEKIVLLCLERGNLQNLIFDNPQSKTQAFFRVLVGTFLKLSPVKKTLMSDALRSSFLKTMTVGAKNQGMEWFTKF